MFEQLRLLYPEEAKTYADILAGYRPSDEIIKQFAASNFGVIAGPTGVGKDTIRDILIQKDPEVFTTVLSTTSRPPRDLEVEGVDYRFRDLNFFNEGLRPKRFLQAAVVHNQQISALDYADIEEIGVGQIGLAILTVQTEIQLRQFHPSMKTVFLVTPDLRTLTERLNKDRTMAFDEQQRRFEAAKTELRIALNQPTYQCIINDEIERATEIAAEYFKTGELNSPENEIARKAIQQTLNELSI